MTYEIDYKAPVAVIKKALPDRYATANVYKVKRYASFVIHFIGQPSPIYCGTPDQVETFVKVQGLCLLPKNSRGRKYLHYLLNI